MTKITIRNIINNHKNFYFYEIIRNGSKVILSKITPFFELKQSLYNKLNFNSYIYAEISYYCYLKLENDVLDLNKIKYLDVTSMNTIMFLSTIGPTVMKWSIKDKNIVIKMNYTHKLENISNIYIILEIIKLKRLDKLQKLCQIW